MAHSSAGHHRIMFALNSALFVFVAPALVWASEGGHHGGGSISDLFWPWINFLLFVGIMFVLLRKPFPQALNARRDLIRSQAERGKIELQTAQQTLRVARERLATLDAEIQRTTSAISEDAKREGVQIVTDAHARAERIKKQTADSLSAEVRSREVAMRKQIAQQVMDRATAELRNELTAESDRNLRKGVMSGLRSLVH